jgi:hypothetical protein
MTQGWPNQLNGQLKDAARMESEMIQYLFTDATSFLSRSITIYMDERSTRENLLQFMKLLNVAAPFLIMNDFRIAKQQQQLQRVMLLEKLMKQL